MAPVTPTRPTRPDTGPTAAPLPMAELDATLIQTEDRRPDTATIEPVVGSRLGRFAIFGRLGAGNMGVVFTAYDDVLDRKVAVKVLRGGGPDASLRLLREAQAMARVDHPNVVTVHEVGTADGQVYVAMEFIRGVTLQAWQRDPSRTWEELVDAYVQAGRGLAAAHAAGLVHRDFKASNAMIDGSGRVRVLDFGLVRAQVSDEAPLQAPRSHDSMAMQLTHAGDVLGTPAYMSPEQITGLPVGPASDQFSLCVSLHEALYGSLPFPGDDLATLLQSIQRHRLIEAPRGSRVPAFVRAALLRGLQPVPEDRYPSMDALLRALGAGSTLRRRRRRLAVAVGAAACAALAGFLFARTQAPALCSGAAAELAAVYGDEQRAALGRALAAAGPAFDAELRPAVLAVLDDYAAAWTRSHQGACQAHARGEQSDPMLDRRMACLAQRRTALGAALGVLAEADATVAIEALHVVHDLPPVSRCDDLVVLAAEVAPPRDPATVIVVSEVRGALARAETLANAGKITDAIALAESGVQAALRSDYRPLIAEALLTRVRLALNVVHDSMDEPRLTRAMLVGIASGMDEVAAEAAALAVYVRGRFVTLNARALDGVPLAEALANRLPHPQATLGLLANNVGTVHLWRGELDEAHTAFQRALTGREQALGPDDPELANTLFNLALVERDDDLRARHLQRAVDILTRAFGVAHPLAIDVRIMAARELLDPNAAHALLLPGCEALERFASGDLGLLARCLADLGHHEAEAGHPEAAAAHYARVGALLGQGTSSMTHEQRVPIAARVAWYRGEPTAAIEPLRRELADLKSRAVAIAWWQQRAQAELELALGESLGSGDEAISVLTAAVADFEASKAQARDVYGQQCLARAHLRLAELLSLGRGTPQEISLHLQAAEAWYRAAGAYAWRLAAIEGMRAKTSLEPAAAR